MKKCFIKWNLILGAVIPSIINAGTMQTSGPGNITVIRATSEYHESVPSGQTETIFKLDSGHVGCSYLGVNNNEKGFISLLLSAQAQSRKVTVWYYPDKFSPLWNTVCQAATIEVKYFTVQK